MRVTVKIGKVEVTVERNNFLDYSVENKLNGMEVRTNIMKDTVLPTIKECVEKANTLYMQTNDNG